MTGRRWTVRCRSATNARTHEMRRATDTVVSVVGRFLFRVIDDEHGHRAFLQLELQPELLGKGVQQGEGAARFRCRKGATGARRRAGLSASASGAALHRADRAEIEAEVKGAVDLGVVRDRRM